MSAELRHFLLTVRAAPECRPRTSAEQRRSEAAEPVPHVTQRMPTRHPSSSPVSNQASDCENTQRSCTGVMVLAVEEPECCVHDQHAERRSLHGRRFGHDQASTPSTTELACALDLQYLADAGAVAPSRMPSTCTCVRCALCSTASSPISAHCALRPSLLTSSRD